jgi:asparagine synthase (glutamine-hydrolysing)
LRHWLQTILKPLVDDVLSDTCLRARGVFNPATVKQLRQADLAGRVDATYTIFSMVCLELWCRQYIDGAYALDSNL